MNIKPCLNSSKTIRDQLYLIIEAFESVKSRPPFGIEIVDIYLASYVSIWRYFTENSFWKVSKEYYILLVL